MSLTNTNLDLTQTLSCLPEKFIVDFANGIDVAKDHIRIQRNRTGFFNRFYDGFTGQGAQRQTEINASLADGVDGALKWLTELTASLAHSNYAIVKVNERIKTLLSDVTTLVHYSADTRRKLEDFSLSLNARCDLLAKELARVDFEQRAERQLEQVFNKWAAGRLDAFSIAGRCYATIEELYWGDFGDFCRSHNNRVRQGFIDDLIHRAMRQLSIDICNESSQQRFPTYQWLAPPVNQKLGVDAREALAYLGDWSESESHPFVFTTSQLPDELPLALPRICESERLAKALVTEVFDRRCS
ncbi:diguanylate cyclase regulator RdcB family protein [Methylomonas koyamae]|uniref:diguanylate cyclase regulator RdcB family protein n=1 Tax=Methylomonas koyamae TaxID=702114 RepID=UPI0028730C4B|nr:diguanylate cyclase regulator RdcB family protein [Methylomonas koyamae]WNB75765.1 diguanylate cyclase regulator RdcB family protein [Methylomonas koyamae]